MNFTDYTPLRNFTPEDALFGYCRISKNDDTQDLNHQREAIKRDYPTIRDCDIYEDIGTGYSFKPKYRPKWNVLISLVKRGSTIIFYDFSRFSRHIEEGIKAYKNLSAAGIHLVFITQPEFNNDYLIEAYEKLRAIRNHLESMHEQTERRKQRTKEGMKAAAQKGRKPGAKKDSHPKREKEFRCKPIIARLSKSVKQEFPDLDMCKGTHSEKDCLEYLQSKTETHISRGTYNKYKREVIAELTEYTRSGTKPHWMKRRRTSRKKSNK